MSKDISMSIGVSSQDVVAIQNLIASYFQRVDRPSDRSAAELFIGDAVLSLGTVTIEGRSNIAQFFVNRNNEQIQSGRVTRHLSSGVELEPAGDGEIAGHSTAVVFAGSGSIPQPAALPSTICDFDDIYVRSAEGWLFKERRATVIFTGAGAASFAKNNSIGSRKP